MMKKISIIIWVVLFFACAAGVQPEKNSDIQALKEKLKSNPQDPETLRDFGLLCLQSEQYSLAESFLELAHKTNPRDPKISFYLGLSYELLGDTLSAMNIYRDYNHTSELSHFKRLMKGRYFLLDDRISELEMQELLKRENDLGLQNFSLNTVAVFPLVFKGGEVGFSAFGKGFSQILSMDLAKVPSLKLVEQNRLKIFLNENKNIKINTLNPESAMRIGKLFGVGQILFGDYTVENNKLTMNISRWDLISRHFPSPRTFNVNLSDMYQIEKKIIFDLIKKTGLTINNQTQDEILAVPTNNFRAFMAFSKGVFNKDRDQLDLAQTYFKKAVDLDPQFELASEKANQTACMTMAKGTPFDYIDTNRFAVKSGDQNLVSTRLNKLGRNMGTNFIPGQDNRKPIEIFAIEIPEPPPPPQN